MGTFHREATASHEHDGFAETERSFIGQCYHAGSELSAGWEDLYEEGTPEEAERLCVLNDRKFDAHLLLDPNFGNKPPRYRVMERVVLEREVMVFEAGSGEVLGLRQADPQV